MNVNYYKPQIKRHRLTELIKKQDPTICCIQEMHLTGKDSHWLEVKGQKFNKQCNWNPKQAGVVTPITDKTVFKSKSVRRWAGIIAQW